MAKTMYRRLKAVFATAVLGVSATSMSAAMAQEVDDAVQLNDTPTPAVASAHPVNKSDSPDRRRLDQKTDDFFDQKFKVYATKESFFIGQPARHDFPLLNLPSDSGITITRQYLDIKPMRKEWYGHASGVGYGLDLALDQPVTIRNSEWHLASGIYVAAFDSPDRFENRDTSKNNITSGYVEGATDVQLGNLAGNMVVGVSYSKRYGPDIEHGNEDIRLYQQIDFPSLFNGASSPNNYNIGRFSGMVKTHVGTDNYGATLGVYFNDLKGEGKGVNYSFGPEVRYDSNEGASVRLRIRIAPKIF